MMSPTRRFTGSPINPAPNELSRSATELKRHGTRDEPGKERKRRDDSRGGEVPGPPESIARGTLG
jgi:hypothetical protein